MPIQPFPDFPSLSILPDCSTMIETKTLRAAQLYQLHCRLRCRAPHVSARASLPFSGPTRVPQAGPRWHLVVLCPQWPSVWDALCPPVLPCRPWL